jgi:ribosome-binding protein aMBF1 (putative translation factor)
MNSEKRTSNAVKILHQRYIGGDSERKASLEQERVGAEVARTIYELREQAGLSQRELAEKVGTTQSVISRLEDSDYEGHSLSMLSRIAKALNRQVQVVMQPKDLEAENVRFAFREVIRGMRKQKGLSIEQLARKMEFPAEELAEIERDCTYRPTPLALHKLSKFFEIPQRKLAVLAGAITDIPPSLRQRASSFAANSDSFSKLTSEEKKLLDEFVRFLREEVS